MKWREPRDVEEAKARSEKLLEDIAKIEEQLGKRETIVLKGKSLYHKEPAKRLTRKEYVAWRTSAKRVRFSKMSDYRKIKDWLNTTTKQKKKNENGNNTKS